MAPPPKKKNEGKTLAMSEERGLEALYRPQEGIGRLFAGGKGKNILQKKLRVLEGREIRKVCTKTAGRGRGEISGSAIV